MVVVNHFGAEEAAEPNRLAVGYKRFHALHSNVLCFAQVRVEGAWDAYCFPVPGINHHKEWPLWQKHGNKMDERIALAIFPEFAGLPYAY